MESHASRELDCRLDLAQPDPGDTMCQDCAIAHGGFLARSEIERPVAGASPRPNSYDLDGSLLCHLYLCLWPVDGLSLISRGMVCLRTADSP